MRRTAAWILFGLGDLVWRLNTAWTRRPSLYPLYNFLMTRSSDLQGDGPNGPWSSKIKRSSAKDGV